jgi:uncharacterized protein YlxW (UPF0749 family)
LRRRVISQVCMAALLLAVGVLVVAQLRVQKRLRAQSYDPGEQAVLLSELVDADRRLRSEIGLLEAQYAAYQVADRGGILEELVGELNRVRVLNGVVEVSGPGVEVLVDGPLRALDLQDLVNELRNAGAEAIAVNGHRLIASSVFGVADGGALMVDGKAVQRPYQLEAIGDPDTIETAFLRQGGLVSVLRQSYPNLYVQTTQHLRLVVGVHQPRSGLEYGEPVY